MKISSTLEYNQIQKLILEVRDFLLNQNAISVASDEQTRCLYLSPTGLKCAVGCLIPSSKYKTGMENKDVIDLMTEYPKLLDYLSKKYKIHSKDYLINVLSEMQKIHDHYSVEEWKNEFDILISNNANGLRDD